MTGGRRDIVPIISWPDAVRWAEEFGHTVADEQARRVIDILMAEKRSIRDLQNSLESKQNTICELHTRINHLNQKIIDAQITY